MTKVIQTVDNVAMISLRKPKNGKIIKGNKVAVDGISVEKKEYTLSELSGLQGKFKKIDTALQLGEEKNEGKSIMINMRTTVFELLKTHLMKLLEKNPYIKQAEKARTVKAKTDFGTEADVEYHVDVTLAVD